MKYLPISNCYVCPFWAAPCSTDIDDKGICKGFKHMNNTGYKDLFGLDINNEIEWCPLISFPDSSQPRYQINP